MRDNMIMVIAGTDSSGGAGLTRDTAVANALGFGVFPVVTSVTAQTHSGMTGTAPMSADFVRKQIDAACASGSFRAVKVGMLGTADIAECVADWLSQHPVSAIIDPVLRASSGGDLMAGGLPASLLSQADLLTPNLAEAAALAGRPIARNLGEIAAQADEILSGGPAAVLIKGGHGTGAAAVDHLFEPARHQTFSAPRLAKGKRGTGCTLATAIACQVASGHDLAHACRRAKNYVQAWLGDSPAANNDNDPCFTRA